MKDRIIKEIRHFVQSYQDKMETSTTWGIPIIRFSSADNPLFPKLKSAVSPTHLLPQDMLPEARTVISFFLPFPPDINKSNNGELLSSEEWATGYIETNELIGKLGEHMAHILNKENHKLVTIPATHNWIEDKLISNWSHRHAAFISGLGTFGLNNMLITDRGCSGRIGTLITSAQVAPDEQPEHEGCLFKHNGSCKKCIRKCVNEALLKDSFDRFKCYDQLLKNVEKHKSLGYADVCGKCLAAVPCSHNNPVKLKKDKTSHR